MTRRASWWKITVTSSRLNPAVLVRLLPTLPDKPMAKVSAITNGVGAKFEAPVPPTGSMAGTAGVVASRCNRHLGTAPQAAAA